MYSLSAHLISEIFRLKNNSDDSTTTVTAEHVKSLKRELTKENEEKEIEPKMTLAKN
jgi:hypothetical protein